MTRRIAAEYSGFRGRGSLADVVEELSRQVEASADFVADTRDMTFGRDTRTGGLTLRAANKNLWDFVPEAGLPFLDQSLVQVANKAPISGGEGRTSTGIPARFFRNSTPAS